MSVNNRSNVVAFDNFVLALRGLANTWLNSQIPLKNIVGDQERWTIIRPFFKEEFAIESDDKLILDRLAHMAMQPTENVHDFFGHLNKISRLIMDAYKNFILMHPELAPNVNGDVSLADMRAHYAARDEAYAQFYLHNKFRVALPVDLQ